MINGIINVTNPSNITVFNTFLEFSEISLLTTDIVWSAGRNGTMMSGGAGIIHTITDIIGNNTNNYSLGFDMDNDANITDYLYHNSTHLIFNLSNEGVIYVNLSNSTANPISIALAGAGIEMTDVNITGSSRVLGNISISGLTLHDNVLNGSYLSITLNEHPESPISLNIPELRPTNFTTFLYLAE